MSEYHHRAWHNTIVVGDYLYIDGGELTTWDGSGDGLLPTNDYSRRKGDILTVPDNRTYSIDLTSSWTNSTVNINSIFKAAQVYSLAVLWPDASGKSFYSYDGGYSASVPIVNVTENTITQFKPDGSSGSWSPVVTPASSNFSSLARIQGACFGYDYDNGVGFALGGRESQGTTSRVKPGGKAPQVPGLVVYDSSSNEWFNLSSTGYSPTGFASRGSLQFIPQFGTKGLVVAVGGDANLPDAYVPLNIINMYDHATQQWALQNTTGENPQPSRNLCTVGVRGDEGTYEIFVYGGWAKGYLNPDVGLPETLDNGAVYVLTLPAFHWLKQTSPITFPRYGHSCKVVGNSQMIVTGGIPVTKNSTLRSIPPDSWTSGIGIFNLTAMNWSSEYDAHAAAYTSPSIVKEYYRSNSRYPEWSDAQAKSWFIPEDKTSPNITATITQHKSSTNVGAIAGGTIGGVIGLLIICFAIWYLRRRTRSEPVATETAESTSGTRPSELAFDDKRRTEAGGGQLSEAHADYRPHESGGGGLNEVAANERLNEAGGVERKEMPANERPSEAPNTALYELPQPEYELSSDAK